MGDKKYKILIYCPEAAILQHHMIMLNVGRILAARGHQVDAAFCDGLFERCVAFDGRSLPAGAPLAMGEALCLECGILARHSIGRAELRPVDLEPYHSRRRVYEAARLVDAAADPRSIVVDGYDFGALALHDVVLSRKILLDAPLSPADVTQLKETARTAILIYLAMRDMLADRGYTHVLTMGHYTPLAAVAMAAREEGVEWRHVSNPSHYGNDRRRLTINPFNGRHIWFSHMKAWPAWRNVPLTKEEIFEIIGDILLRMRGLGSHTYSPAKTAGDVLETLGLSAKRKLIVAFTSSLDERQANDIAEQVWRRPGEVDPFSDRPLAFADQVEWLCYLVDWCRDRDDVQLVIRVHPREDSNKRDTVRSRHLERLERELKDLPPNVRVIWPRDEVSSYDLLEAAHLAQAAWSTIGLEAARLGAPVMACDGFNTYPLGDFILSAPTPEDFGRMMERLLNEPPDLERMTLALRYYALSRLNAAVDISDLNPNAHAAELRPFTPPAHADIVERLVLTPTTAQEIHLSRRPAATAASFETEREMIRFLGRLLVRHFLTGEPPSSDYNLGYADVDEDEMGLSVSPPAGTAIVLRSGDVCRFIGEGRDIVKRSPAAARLLPGCVNLAVGRRKGEAASAEN